MTVQNKLASLNIPIKLVEPQNLHITLIFLGEKNNEEIKLIKERMKPLSDIKSFIVKLSGVGAFPNMKKPRVIWVGVSENNEKIREVYNALLSSFGKDINYDLGKEFTSHITLGRVKRFVKEKSLVSALLTLKNMDFGPLEVNEIKLKKSVLTPKGPVYETLFSVKLAS